jgi:hypothetical protein
MFIMCTGSSSSFSTPLTPYGIRCPTRTGKIQHSARTTPGPPAQSRLQTGSRAGRCGGECFRSGEIANPLRSRIGDSPSCLRIPPTSLRFQLHSLAAPFQDHVGGARNFSDMDALRLTIVRAQKHSFDHNAPRVNPGRRPYRFP